MTTDSTVCNGDEQDTDSKSVDMESLSELKGQISLVLLWFKTNATYKVTITILFKTQGT